MIEPDFVFVGDLQVFQYLPGHQSPLALPKGCQKHTGGEIFDILTGQEFMLLRLHKPLKERKQEALGVAFRRPPNL